MTTPTPTPTPNSMPGAQPPAGPAPVPGQPAPTTPPAAPSAPGGAPTPPWGEDPAKYDPDTAARLIANLRASENSQGTTIKSQSTKIAELEAQLADARPLLDAATEQKRREQGELETMRQDFAAIQAKLTAAETAAQDHLVTALNAKVAELASNRDPNRPGSAFVNPATAAKLIELTDCLTDGKIDETAIASKLDALAQSDPYLVAATTSPGGHRPNPAQGHGNTALPLDAQIKAAEERGDIMASIALKQQKHYQTRSR